MATEIREGPCKLTSNRSRKHTELRGSLVGTLGWQHDSLNLEGGTCPDKWLNAWAMKGPNGL